MNKTDSMKRISTVLAAVLLIAGLHSKVLAQSNATTTASANVVQNLEVGEESQNLDFGDMLAGTLKQISAFDGAVSLLNDARVNGGEQRGFIRVETAAGSTVNVSLAVPSNLQDSNDNTLPVDFDTNYGGTNQGTLNFRITEVKPTGSTEVNNIPGYGFSHTYSSGVWSLDSGFAMPASGTFYFTLGGEVSAGENQPLGEYSGDITLTVTLNN